MTLSHGYKIFKKYYLTFLFVKTNLYLLFIVIKRLNKLENGSYFETQNNLINRMMNKTES